MLDPVYDVVSVLMFRILTPTNLTDNYYMYFYRMLFVNNKMSSEAHLVLWSMKKIFPSV